MEKKIDMLIEKMSDLETKINNLRQDIDDIKLKTAKMEKHVNFINGVYDTVEKPLNYAMDRWNNLIGNKTDNNNADTKIVELKEEESEIDNE